MGVGRSARPIALTRTRPYPRVIRGYPSRPTYRPVYPDFNQQTVYEDESYDESGSDYPQDEEDYEDGVVEDEYGYEDEELVDEHEEEEETGDDEDEDFVSQFYDTVGILD